MGVLLLLHPTVGSGCLAIACPGDPDPGAVRRPPDSVPCSCLFVSHHPSVTANSSSPPSWAARFNLAPGGIVRWVVWARSGRPRRHVLCCAHLVFADRPAQVEPTGRWPCRGRRRPNSRIVEHGRPMRRSAFVLLLCAAAARPGTDFLSTGRHERPRARHSRRPLESYAVLPDGFCRVFFQGRRSRPLTMARVSRKSKLVRASAPSPASPDRDSYYDCGPGEAARRR